MKHLLILFILLCCASTTNASWFSKSPSPLDEAKARITSLENQITVQASTRNRWQIATGSLAVACILLLIIGAALGAQTRKHYDGQRRLGSATPTPPTGINGRKPGIMGKDADDTHLTTLVS